MTYPTVTPTSERWYGLLPEYLRRDDALEPSGGGYPLLRWLSLDGDALDRLTELVRRMTPALNDGHSDLFEPARSDAAWLDWLAVQQGVDPTLYTDPTLLRAAIEDAPETWVTAGTLDPILDIVRSHLQGTQRVDVTLHAGGPWRIAISTRPSETPDPELILAALAVEGVTPAWVLLLFDVATGPWSDLAGGWPASNTGTWEDLEFGGGGAGGGAIYGTFDYGDEVYGAAGGDGPWSFLAEWEPA